ncbi:MAG: OmpA family protein [Thermoguttaceae bacterium]|jgi:chemotaxis protein MotB|nr:OmpA family protein [Thermoguttaceae bacterium]
MAGKGGGAWKVAYADFVTAMMAFFLVMWITAQSKQVKQAVAHYFNYPSASKRGMEDGPPPSGPGVPGQGGPGAEGPEGTGKLGDIQGIERIDLGIRASGQSVSKGGAKPAAADTTKGPKANKPSLLAVHDGDRRMVGTVVLFDEQSAELSDAAKARLKSLAPLLAGKRNKIELRGHATRRPLPPGSPFQDAWHLSYARCLAVRKYLESQGIEPERIRLSQAGPFEPKTIRADVESQAENSRVEIYVLAEYVEDLVGTPEERAQRFKTP